MAKPEGIMVTAIAAPRVRESWKPREITERVAGPLLVATDASASADDALRAAHAIATRTGLPVTLLAIHEPPPMVASELQLAESPDMLAESRESLRAQVRTQLDRVGVDDDWPLQVVSGDPAVTIVNVAKSVDASLVIMGLGGHGMFDRLLGDETVLKVLRLGTVPVLAVAPAFLGLPTCVLAATDFSPSSAHALSLGTQLMAPGGRLTLGHVMSSAVDPANWTNPNVAFRGTVGGAFDRLLADLDLSETCTVKRQILAGDPAKALLDFAASMQADLIVAGSHGYGLVTRLLLGSVSQRLIRGARCSVLVVPPESAPSFLDELPEVTSRFAAYEWAERLEEFTRRNVGRMATLEVIDLDIGAQIEERGFPLVGASFDPRDGRVQIMLGSPKLEGKHLTRSIGGATAIQVLRDRSGRDMLLRVAHGRGQTLLTLER